MPQFDTHIYEHVAAHAMGSAGGLRSCSVSRFLRVANIGVAEQLLGHALGRHGTTGIRTQRATSCPDALHNRLLRPEVFAQAARAPSPSLGAIDRSENTTWGLASGYVGWHAVCSDRRQPTRKALAHRAASRSVSGAAGDFRQGCARVVSIPGRYVAVTRRHTNCRATPAVAWAAISC